MERVESEEDDRESCGTLWRRHLQNDKKLQGVSGQKIASVGFMLWWLSCCPDAIAVHLSL